MATDSSTLACSEAPSLKTEYATYALKNFRVKAAARELDCSPATIFRRFQDGSLRRIKVGGTTLVSGADILRLRGDLS
jgi:hypothetical protein